MFDKKEYHKKYLKKWRESLKQNKAKLEEYRRKDRERAEKYRKTQRYKKNWLRYFQLNKERYKTYRKKYHEEHPTAQKDWYHKNLDRARKGTLSRYYRRREKVALYRKKYRAQNIYKVKAIQRKSSIKTSKNTRIREQLLTLLGCKCFECGYSKSISALQIDHINGQGNEYSENVFYNGTHMYRYYLANPWKAERDLQILCANCNWIKRSLRKETPNTVVYPIMTFLQ